MSYEEGNTRGGYHGVFERLSTTETKSSYTRKISPRSSAEKKSPYYTYNINTHNIPHIQSGNSSSSRLVSPKIFERLANTETYATASMKGKVANHKRSKSQTRKTSNAFFERMAYTETFASATMKGLIDTSPKKPQRDISRGRSVASARSARSSRSTRTAPNSSQFWDRMSNTETYASAKMKGKIEHVEYDSYGEPSPSKSVRSSRSVRSHRTTESKSSFFERLSRTETMSSMRKKKKNDSLSRTPSRSPRSYSSSRSGYSSSYSKPASIIRKSPRQSSQSTTPSYGVSKYLNTPTAQPRSRRSYGSSTTRTSRDRSISSTKSGRSTNTARSARSTNTARSARSTNTARSARSTNTARSARSTNTARSMRSTHTSSSVRTSKTSRSTASRSVASTRSMTTARSTATSIKTARSSTTAKSKEFSYHNHHSAVRPSERNSASSILRMTNDRGPKPIPAPGPAPKRQVRPKPEAVIRKPEPPRPVLQFDDDDELSFGSEESDEASLGPTSVKASQDAGSVASKSIASRRSIDSIPTVEPISSVAETVAPALLRHDENSEGEEEEILPEPEVEQEPEEEIDDFLNDLDTNSNEHAQSEDNEMPEEEPAYHEEPAKEVEAQEKTAELAPASFVDEDDDDFSFGSEEDGENEENDWLKTKTDKADDTNQEQSPPVDNDEDELADVLASPESNGQESADEPNELELEPAQSLGSMSDEEVPMQSPESMDEEQEETPEDDHDDVVEESIEVVKTVSDSQEYAQEENDMDLEYDDESVSEHEVEDDYDEKEDLRQMDSLDLVLDLSKSNNESQAPAALADADLTYEDEEEAAYEDEEDFRQTESTNTAEKPTSSYVILKSEKYHPEYGFEEIDPDTLYFKETLEAFESGDISNEEISILLIEAMFDKDFVGGDHWEIDSGTARELEEDEGGGGDLEDRAFVVKRQARLDWNDLYSVAAAKGTIMIEPDKKELRIENYSYFVAG